jgi:hypothetical protein
VKRSHPLAALPMQPFGGTRSYAATHGLSLRPTYVLSLHLHQRLEYWIDEMASVTTNRGWALQGCCQSRHCARICCHLSLPWVLVIFHGLTHEKLRPISGKEPGESAKQHRFASVVAAPKTNTTKSAVFYLIIPKYRDILSFQITIFVGIQLTMSCLTIRLDEFWWSPPITIGGRPFRLITCDIMTRSRKCPPRNQQVTVCYQSTMPMEAEYEHLSHTQPKHEVIAVGWLRRFRVHQTSHRRARCE